MATNDTPGLTDVELMRARLDAYRAAPPPERSPLGAFVVVFVLFAMGIAVFCITADIYITLERTAFMMLTAVAAGGIAAYDTVQKRRQHDDAFNTFKGARERDKT